MCDSTFLSPSQNESGVNSNKLDISKLEFDIFLNLMATIYSSMIYYPKITINTLTNFTPINTFIDWTNEIILGKTRYSVFLGKVDKIF